LIAGEEPELCTRLRQEGYKILRLDMVMTWHDLAIRSWGQYWRRAVRTGHAYAEIAQRSASTSVPLWQGEARRNAVHAIGLSGVLLAPVLLWLFTGSVWSLAAWIVPVPLVLRTAFRWARAESIRTRLLYALHSHVQQLPIFCGQLTYWLARLQGRRQTLIEYQSVEAS
jgi:hypothetical protein